MVVGKKNGCRKVQVLILQDSRGSSEIKARFQRRLDILQSDLEEVGTSNTGSRGDWCARFGSRTRDEF